MSETTHLFAAIMFTDVVGYTAMMGADEAETLQLVQKNHDMQKSLIRKHNGTIVKELGDGLLAYFESVNQAVRCSLAIQKQTRDDSKVNLRIGLHWAEIVLKDDDIYGDGVNIASRIEPLSDPGGIYISEAVQYALYADDEFSLKCLGSAMLKNVRKPVVIYALQGEGVPLPSMKRFHSLANPKRKITLLPTVIAFLAIVIIALLVVKYLDNRANIIQAEASLDQIEEMMKLNWRDQSDAYYLVKEAEIYIPKNLKLRGLLKQSSVNINITTDPPGAEVFIKQYKHPEDEWQYLGTTPLDSVQVPASILRWKLEKPGYEPIMAAALTFTFSDPTRMQRTTMFTGQDFHRVLDESGTIPEGMTRVSGGTFDYGELPDFFIDMLEVSNRQYKDFMDHEGYEVSDNWQTLKSAFSDSLEWQGVLSKFTDKTGRPGPAYWENQNYPAGMDNYPVTGISWYEANAFAHFVEKSLPTKDHWGLARGESNMIIKFPQLGGNAIFAPFSNFSSNSPVETGSLPGVTSYGAYDMAGNIREWCWNESLQGRWMRGGAWNDNPYMFGAPSQANPFDRSERNGFRCALYPDQTVIPETAFVMAEDKFHIQQMSLPEPVSDEQFNVFKAYYEYDKIDLFEELISSKENKEGWMLEKVEFDAAYNNERMTAYLFLPTNINPPYQTVIYGPGSNVLWQENSDNIETFFEFTAFLEFFVRSGRAVVFPVIKGSFERREESPSFFQHGTHRFTNYITKVVKDYRRCLDYLETRVDFDMDKVAFFGMSMGPTLGGYLSAVEPRIKTNIFYAGGLDQNSRPEANVANFIPRIKTPTLMINGRYDSIFGLDGIMNMYNLLGTPEGDKRLVLFDSDHLAPQKDLVRETLAWLNEQFGQVVYIGDLQKL